MSLLYMLCDFFFFNDTATTEIYTLSLHDALPISNTYARRLSLRPMSAALLDRFLESIDLVGGCREFYPLLVYRHLHRRHERSEEHTSELQSRQYLVCRLLLEKKKKTILT